MKKLILRGFGAGMIAVFLGLGCGDGEGGGEANDFLGRMSGRYYGIDMVFVEGEMFMMGCTKELSDSCKSDNIAHEVTVSDFYIGKYEVTQELWKKVMGVNNNPSSFKDDSLPVDSVSWMDVQDFIAELNKKTGNNYRLPTEAEWEYAARGGNQSDGYKYSGNNTLGNVAWYYDNSDSKIHPVGRHKPNELKIYDMSGNVWEWVFDWFDNGYHVVRGGSWQCKGNENWPDEDVGCRVYNRNGFVAHSRYNGGGFRIAHSLPYPYP